MSIALEMIKKQMKQVGPSMDLRPEADFAKQRAILADPKNQPPTQKGVTFEKAVLSGVPVEFAHPQAKRSGSLILYVHGGGFAFGDEVTSRPYASVLAAACGMSVCSVGYRLAPEHRYPAGVEDCFAVYQELLRQNPGRKIALVGESAGGTLVLVTALLAKEHGAALPCCIFAISPCCTMAEELPSREKNRAVDLVLSNADLGKCLEELYLEKGADPYDPHVSPMYADYQGFPPVLLTVDGSEVLRDEVRRTRERMEQAGVHVEYRELTGTFHSFPTLGGICPEGKEILDESVRFLTRYC
ncbi:MAG: alpha/beta hydrolase [Lachnospiraceae bacterium]